MRGRGRAFCAGIVIILASTTWVQAAVYVDAWIDAEAHIQTTNAGQAVAFPPKKFSTFGVLNSINADATIAAVNAFASAGGNMTVNSSGISISAGGSYNKGSGVLGSIGCDVTGQVIFQITPSAETLTITGGILAGGDGQYTIHGPSVNETIVAPLSVNRTFTPGKYTLDFIISPLPTPGGISNGSSSFSLPMSMVAPEPSSMFAVGAVTTLLVRRPRRSRHAA